MSKTASSTTPAATMPLLLHSTDLIDSSAMLTYSPGRAAVLVLREGLLSAEDADLLRRLLSCLSVTVVGQEELAPEQSRDWEMILPAGGSQASSAPWTGEERRAGQERRQHIRRTRDQARHHDY